jgi:hypothetical protein
VDDDRLVAEIELGQERRGAGALLTSHEFLLRVTESCRFRQRTAGRARALGRRGLGVLHDEVGNGLSLALEGVARLVHLELSLDACRTRMARSAGGTGARSAGQWTGSGT